ncbi:MAG: HD domain-containing protein [Desulfobacterales bacterium]|nr:HD domain-containing protein [Desulfobacterales bacterium]
MRDGMLSIANLIEIVKQGGRVKTGVDVYNTRGVLLLGKDVLVDKVRPLEVIRENGIRNVPIQPMGNGGVWDENGHPIQVSGPGRPPGSESILPPGHSAPGRSRDSVEERLEEIAQIKAEAAAQHEEAKTCLKKALDQIRETNGEFDVAMVQDQVERLSGFLVENDHPFSYMNRAIFSHNEYLYNHAINVCAIATAVLHQFNDSFSSTVEGLLTEHQGGDLHGQHGSFSGHFRYYYPEEMAEMSMGFFLYDIGKASVPMGVLNKKSPLTAEEFDMVRRHSYDFGLKILEENKIQSTVVRNVVAYHHGPIYEGEPGCYPTDRPSRDIPLYVRICKLADSYDAMISKRSYSEALNQISAVTELFRKYVKKDPMLQFILHAFVKSIGIHPPGSLVYLKNGQMAYVLESKGPILIPFTDAKGDSLSHLPDPIDAGRRGLDPGKTVNSEKRVRLTREIYQRLPDYIRRIAVPAA